MESILCVWSVLILFSLVAAVPPANRSNELNSNEDEAKIFLQTYDREYSALLNQYSVANWNYETNMTEENKATFEAIGMKVSEYSSAAYANASQFDSSQFSFDTKRRLSRVGSKSISKEEMEELFNIQNKMGSIYSNFQACRNHSVTGEHQCLSLEPDLTNVMAYSRDYNERLWAWKTWHEGVGRQIRPLYLRSIELKNKIAKVNGYADYGDQWRQKYETKELEPIVGKLHAQVEPLYKQLHAYIRRKLYETYGSQYVDLKGPLPVHLLGDMWGRFWINLNSIVQPYPEKPSVDPTREMLAQNYTVLRMFQMGDDFYRSMGMKPVPNTFYNLSMLEKPTDREVTCHATAWDLYDGQDFRIRMCTRITFEDFLTVHHELGHIQYFLQYAHQPLVYKDGANDGFHEAVGELMSMSVATTKHLKSIGLLNMTEDDPEVDINFLLQQALHTVSTVPFHLVQDTWRWQAFAGQIPEHQLNTEFWRQKLEIVGVVPPVERDPLKDLDITALFHVANDYDMIRYFTRTIMQYQFAETLCNASGHTGPLYKCDLYNSKNAGAVLGKMLTLGSSLPWQDAMEVLTGQREIVATPLLNYFEPLRVWLEKKNKESGEYIGWNSARSSRAINVSFLWLLITISVFVSIF